MRTMSCRIWLLLGLVAGTLLATACGDDIVILRRGPSEAQALVSLQRAIAQGARVFSVPLPRGITVASVRLTACESAKPQQGFRCVVDMATPDIPILGSFVATLPIRFVEIKSGEWNAYLM